MFSRLAEAVTRRAGRVLIVTAMVVVFSVLFSSGLANRLSTQGFSDHGSESWKAVEQLGRATGVDAEADVVAVIKGPGPVAEPAGRALVTKIAKKFKSDRAIGTVVTPFDRGQTNRDLISRDAQKGLVIAYLKPGAIETDAPTRIRDSVAADGKTVTLGGNALARATVSETVEEDLRRAELIAFPLLFLLALFVFRGMIAAALPLIVGAITIPVSYALISVYDSIGDLSIFALNLVTGLGLGLAIDYSLLIVTRFREELETGLDTREAVKRTVLTAGRTVAFSSLTVAGSVAALSIFPVKFLYSMGYGGATVALASAAVALIVLPAFLMVLGPRINRFSLSRRTAEQSTAAWHRMATRVMRRPGLVALVTTALLLLVSLPAIGIKFTSVDSSVLPTNASPRIVDETLQREFPPRSVVATHLQVVVSAPPANRSEPVALAKEINAVPNVSSVSNPVLLGKNTWQMAVFTEGTRYSEATQQTVADIRALDHKSERWVGGSSASFVDQRSAIVDHVPLALLIIGGVTFLVLFLMTGSIVLPIKTFIMNLLTLAATFGILVAIFQNGHLEGVLDYTSQDALELTQPVLLFAIAFGLATDYGVFLLGRIKELHDAGQTNDEAVANGVARTGRVITFAAMLFCVAIGAFATSKIIFIKELGIGTALAVAIDATIVRAMLVPSLMVLLGDLNWWAPKPLKRLHRRFGFSEGPSVAGSTQ